MKTIRFSLDQMPERNEGLTLALGHFDGMHRGHQRLFVDASLEAIGDAGALFFNKPFGKAPYLSSTEDKCRYALSSRLDVLYLFDNDERLFSLSAREFIEQVLLPLGTKKVVVGEDFRFGKGRAGDPALLKEYLDVVVVPLLEEEGEKIASSSIKSRIEEGKVDEARKLLGRSYEITGIVKEGFHNGDKLGFPTANIHTVFPYVLPSPGVYCGVVYVSGKAYRAMVNVGINPTIGLLDHPVVEAHILDFDENCYGKTIYCSFLAKIREEKKFASLEDLKEQLIKDEMMVREVFS